MVMKNKIMHLMICITLIASITLQPFISLGATQTVYISEYTEGSSNNKALELYNPTASAIDLAASNYTVKVYFNGSATAGLTISLTGTIPAHGTYVVAHASASASILAKANQTNNAGWFNGDDAVVLLQGSSVLDSIGQIGFDPGTEWGTGLISTADNTLIRDASVLSGDTNPYDMFTPATSWVGYAVDTITDLGTHSTLKYSVTFEPGDYGSFAATQSTGLHYGDATPQAPVATGQAGFTFAGWSPEVSSTVTGSAVYVAQWTQDQYSVTFEPGDYGSFAATQSTGLHYGDATPQAPVATGQAGFTFAGWSPEVSDTVTGSAVYVAQWTQDQYSVTYEPGDHGNFDAALSTGLHYGDATPEAPVATGQAGFTFAGWSPEVSSTVTGSAVYVAQWTQNQYSVTFEPGDHGSFAATQSTGLHYGDATPEAPVATGQAGFTFAGWSPEVSDTVTGSAVYVAQWTQVETVLETHQVKNVTSQGTIVRTHIPSSSNVTEILAPAKGTYFIDEQGNIHYQPNSNSNGFDKIILLIKNQDGTSREITIQIELASEEFALPDTGDNSASDLYLLLMISAVFFMVMLSKKHRRRSSQK